MPSILLFLCLSISAFAGLEKIHVKNLNLEYVLPAGKGEAEKISIGMGHKSLTIPFDLVRTETSFDVITPFIEYSWMNPGKFFHTTEALSVKGLNLTLEKINHSLSAESISLRPENRNDYKASKVQASCQGESTLSFPQRIFDDCLKKMDLTVKRIDVPEDFILYKVTEAFSNQTMAIPGDNLIFSSREGKYALQVYLKYWFYAGLRSWGTLSYENDYKTLVINVDQIKFGYLSVTTLVMDKLKELNKNPNIVVEPPFIRINLGSLNESK